ncbi:hypothetical protein KIPB_005205 [Kipferlia bialata]|uniref:Kelch-type beta propeller n=1 Tax=Kipferlia bialata TaxID=797122 RepID=A0A391NLP3_9EUKA|nr:hypothetical protein KIPB_005205 [Kipferlia bialata]|eukprot:g5205.t1
MYFGGVQSTSLFRYTLSDDSASWEPVCEGAMPPARSSTCLICHEGNLVLFGASEVPYYNRREYQTVRDAERVENTCHILDTETDKWTAVGTPLNRFEFDPGYGVSAIATHGPILVSSGYNMATLSLSAPAGYTLETQCRRELLPLGQRTMTIVGRVVMLFGCPTGGTSQVSVYDHVSGDHFDVARIKTNESGPVHTCMISPETLLAVTSGDRECGRLTLYTVHPGILDPYGDTPLGDE